MRIFMGYAIFILGFISILLALIIIARDRLVSKLSVMAKTQDLLLQKKKTNLEQITDLLNAIAKFCEKLFGQFMPKEKLPIFLILIGIVMCALGWWAAK